MPDFHYSKYTPQNPQKPKKPLISLLCYSTVSGAMAVPNKIG